MALFTENYQEEMMQILKDMAHVRISGTKEEADCAVYLQECCKKMVLQQYRFQHSDIPCKESLCHQQSVLLHGYHTFQPEMPPDEFQIRKIGRAHV